MVRSEIAPVATAINSSIRLHRLPAGRVAAPLIAECFANLECRVIDTRLTKRYDLFILEVVKAWSTPSCKAPKTIHHQGTAHSWWTEK